jgi:DNA (cytosine-5)-methyltransferase 1
VRLLDLFCGVGGSALGFYLVGFEVTGVDKFRQPRYPFDFVLGDALIYLRELDPSRFDAIHAAPPCQRYSISTKRTGTQDYHPDLLVPVRKALKRTGLPYVIENVPYAPLIDPLQICGTERGLTAEGYRLKRHRHFEINWPIDDNWLACRCYGDKRPIIDVTGGGSTELFRKGGGGRPYKGSADLCRKIMGIHWATRDEITEAIPPRYTKLIGSHLMAYLKGVDVGEYVDCPSCPELRPSFERGLVLKGEKHCRMCDSRVKPRKKVRRRKVA